MQNETLEKIDRVNTELDKALMAALSLLGYADVPQERAQEEEEENG